MTLPCAVHVQLTISCGLVVFDCSVSFSTQVWSVSNGEYISQIKIADFVFYDSGRVLCVFFSDSIRVSSAMLIGQVLVRSRQMFHVYGVYI